MVKSLVLKLLRRYGYDVVRFDKERAMPPDFEPDAVAIIKKIRPYTLTSEERVFSLIQAVKYIVNGKIPGDIVECGVWRGGSMMAVAHTLHQLGVSDRELYMFDTYEGMSEPTAEDVNVQGGSAAPKFETTKRQGGGSDWCYASIEDVESNLLSTGYRKEKLHFIKGKVEETLPDHAPGQIAILRLDTDWYESTRHELIHLYPRLSPGGVLILDDYGHWQGARKAVDEYLADQKVTMLLNRVDYTGRIAIKPSAPALAG